MSPGGLWTTPNTSTGQFSNAKKTGGSFKGVRREDQEAIEYLIISVATAIGIGLGALVWAIGWHW